MELVLCGKRLRNRDIHRACGFSARSRSSGSSPVSAQSRCIPQREPSGKVTDGLVTSWAPSAVTCVFANRLVRCAARSSAPRRVSRLAVFRLLLFATACLIASSSVNSGRLEDCSAGAATGGTGERAAIFWPGASVPRVKAIQAVRVRRFIRGNGASNMRAGGVIPRKLCVRLRRCLRPPWV